jgi:hypothetical protein
MLEAVVRARPVALDKKVVGLSESLQGRPKFGLLDVGDSLKKRVRKIAPERAPICAISRAGPSRSSRAASDWCRVGGIVGAPFATSRSKWRRVTSSTNKGTPPLRSLTLSTSCDIA